MVGSFLYNCWAAVIAFTIYFLMTFRSFNSPTSIIIKAFIAASIVFFLTYLVRFIIAFVLYTPPEESSQDGEELEGRSESEVEEQSENDKASEEFSDDQAQKLAKTVKTMMSNDE
ncbi:hypothetical protein [Rummeliibacillus suwonensis]|uniref:hypothetical protein n=1 Tax=Rummeliibacillus suwonensis TaxID=1306154 RepID=UPI001AAE230A|nr:hypothetical protein [Rummeliibacillus suwonensis]MBO2534598.1 hypothetical protein [Rummeliibacillus suwonensis]